MPYEIKNVFACLPQIERGVSKVIGGDPKGNNFLYTNGKSVIIRNIENPAIADVYTEHAQQAVVAKYSPSGFYIASGDISGKLRIWDTTQKEHLLKYEYQPFAGKIKDIAWTEDSKRIAAVGEGREKFGSVFLWDTGSSVGEVGGHSKVINSVDIKQTRPYRLVTGSDDCFSVFSEGPPFKFKFTLSDHSRFVNCVRFSPDGNRFATASADGQIFLYDGKTGEKICALGGTKAHDGGVYAVSWSADSTQLLSSSGDKTAKIWDVGSNSVVNTFKFGNDVLDQQLGCLWQKNYLLSVSLSGYINYLDKNNPDRPLRIIKGHSKAIQCLAVHKNEGRSTIYTGSQDGHINYWDAETGENDTFLGKGHTNMVSDMAVDDASELVTCSMDDNVRYTELTKKEYSGHGTTKLDVQPKALAVGPNGYTVVLCIGQILLMKDKKKCSIIDKLDYEPEAVAVHKGGVTVAVGGSDSKVHLFAIQGNSLKDDGKTLEVKGPVTKLAYSPDGAYLAVSDATRAISVFTVADNYAVNKWWNSLTEGQQTVTGIIAANILVFCLWRVPSMQRTMIKYFTSNPASRTLCLPMILSTFSHFSLFHLGANMYVLWSFSSSIVSLLGPEQFMAVYLSAGVISSFASYAAKMATGRFGPSLGASGAIMTVLAAVCTKMPEAKLAIIFLPMFTFTAASALKGIMALDTAGLILGWRIFDHAAHLGGAIFGIWYVTYGHELMWKKREPLVKMWHEWRTKTPGKRGGS